MASLQSSSRWADEIDDDDVFMPNKVTPTPGPPKVEAKKEKKEKPVPKENERIDLVIKVDPQTGKKTEIYRTFRIEKQLVSQAVIERKKWVKFGQSKNDSVGPNAYTTVVADDVQMEFVIKDKNGLGEIDAELNLFDVAKLQVKGLVRCKYCNGGHFSAKCPFKDDSSEALAKMCIANDSLIDSKKDSVEKPGVFVPSALRGGNRRGETMTSLPTWRDDATIRVSNLPETMTEPDMADLCFPFGKTERIFLAKDRATGLCKGFAFVTFQTRDNAAKAMAYLHGYGYDHLILNVEWSVRPEK